MTIPLATASTAIRRIWSEFVPYSELRSSRVIQLLGERQLELLVAVTPARIDQLADLALAYQDAGVSLGIWPMVDDHEGRWGSTFNAQLYSDFVTRAVERVQDQAAITSVAIDLEPPIDLTRALLAGNFMAVKSLLRLENRHSGEQILQALLEHLGQRGCKSIAAVHPLLLADGHGDSAWQWLLGTPVDTMSFDTVSPMAYTSLIEGYSRGMLSREAAMAILVQTAQAAHERWQQGASVSLGSVGVGALGDERPYRELSELVHDVAMARACGIEDIALFDLGGVLQQEQPEAWLDALVHTAPASYLPKAPKRTRLLENGLKRVGTAIAMYRRFWG